MGQSASTTQFRYVPPSIRDKLAANLNRNADELNKRASVTNSPKNERTTRLIHPSLLIDRPNILTLIICGYCRQHYVEAIPVDIIQLFYIFHDSGGNMQRFQHAGVDSLGWTLSNDDKRIVGISEHGGTHHFAFGEYSYKNDGVHYCALKYLDGTADIKCEIGITQLSHLELANACQDNSIQSASDAYYAKVTAQCQRSDTIVVELNYQTGYVAFYHQKKREAFTKQYNRIFMQEIDARSTYNIMLLSYAYHRWSITYELVNCDGTYGKLTYGLDGNSYHSHLVFEPTTSRHK